MNITRIQAHQIETPRVNGIISGHVILLLHVDDGPIGLGEASDSIASDLDSVVSQYNKLLVGRDATRISEINDFLRTHDFKSTVSDNHLVSAIDLALYDLNGKALGVPAYRLMGGKFRDRIYCCYPTWGNQASVDYEATAGYLQRLVDHGHHLFRYYVSGEADFDNHFLTDMFSRFGDQIRLKQIDFSGRFSDWQTAIRYADVLRHHAPLHFEQPSRDLRVCAEFTKRVDLPVSLHTSTLERGLESIERGACTAFNLCNVDCGPTYIRKLYALAEAAGIYCLIGTDQESTLGIAGQLHLGASMSNLELPCDPMGPLLYTESPATERIHAEGSYLTVPEGPGLGVELDDEKLAALTIASA
jgi:L-alanine-DL-glutamate epimerase-like enolase superfamily enzyme